MHFIKFLSITLFCYSIASCSFIKTSYNNAPKLTIWWLNDYFNFTPAQIHTLEPALNNLHNWHRQQQLPEMITLLKTMQTAFAGNNVTGDALCVQVQAFKTSIYALQTESIPIILEIAPTLTDKQMSRFQSKLDKRTQKWKSQWWQELKKDQLSARLDKAEDFAEKVYGNLSEQQLMYIKQRLTQENIHPAISYSEIIRRNEDAFEILNALRNVNVNNDNARNNENVSNKVVSEQNTEQLTKIKSKLVQAGFDRIQKSPDLAYQKYANDLAKHGCETIASLHATTGAEQKLHAKKWLDDYIVQLTALQIK